MKAKLYLAAPLFSDAERTFNKRVASDLQPYFDVYLPQEDGCLMVEMIADGIPASKAARTVFALDVIAIDKCQALLIILDGRAVDEGAAFELGCAHAQGKICVGLQTDPRRMLSDRNNPMIDCALLEVFHDFTTLLDWARRFSSYPTATITRKQNAAS